MTILTMRDLMNRDDERARDNELAFGHEGCDETCETCIDRGIYYRLDRR